MTSHGQSRGAVIIVTRLASTTLTFGMPSLAAMTLAKSYSKPMLTSLADRPTYHGERMPSVPTVSTPGTRVRNAPSSAVVVCVGATVAAASVVVGAASDLCPAHAV